MDAGPCDHLKQMKADVINAMLSGNLAEVSPVGLVSMEKGRRSAKEKLSI